MREEPVSPYLWMLQASLLFALMAALTHALGAWCDWQLIAATRSLCALGITALIAFAAGERVVSWGPPTLWVRSLAGSVSMVCTFYALTRLPVSDVLTMTNMFPVWVAVLSWPLLREAPPASVWLAVVSAVTGVVLIQQPGLARGDAAILVAAGGSFFTAVAMIGLHRLRDLPPRSVVVHFSAVASCFCVASFFLFDRPPREGAAPAGRVALLLLGVGLTATFGQVLLTRAFAAGSPARVSVVGLTQIVFALALDVVVFGHRVRPEGLLGMALVVGPTVWLMAHREVLHGPDGPADAIPLDGNP